MTRSIGNGFDSLQRKLSELRRKACIDFRKFRKCYFCHYNSLPDAEFHQELSTLLAEISVKRGSKNAIAAPRDSAKSTIVSLQYVVYCICYKIEEFIVMISSTADQAVNLLTNVKQELERNDLLQRDFPEVCEIGRTPGPPRWTLKEIVTRNGVKVIALGVGQQIRGRRNKEHRPSLIILDDVETDESFQTPESFYKQQDWLTKAVLKAGTSTTNVVYVGTIHHYNSLLAQFTNLSSHPGWHKRVYKSVISWAERVEFWERWTRIFNYQESHEGEDGPDAARLFFEARKEAMLKGTKLLWEAKKSYYDLMVVREQDGYASFDSEMQNEPVNPRDCHFNPDEMQYWDVKYETEQDLFSALGGNFDIYGACDPSMGKQTRRGDFSAILTAAVDRKTGIIYVLDADIERRLPDNTIIDIISHHKRRKYMKFAFESNQFQEFMGSELERRAREAGEYLNIEQIKHTSDKLARIQSLQPFVKNGTIQFSKRHHTLLDQMKFFPKGNHDDGLDALEMVFKLCKEGGRIDFEELLRDIEESPMLESCKDGWLAEFNARDMNDW
jgi:predicted phage terminase large subunit-like protein